VVERQRAPIGGIVDMLGEFHRDGTIATRQKTGRAERGFHDLTMSQLKAESCSVFCAKTESGPEKKSRKFNKLMRYPAINRRYRATSFRPCIFSS
jgi:hypothetical protein